MAAEYPKIRDFKSFYIQTENDSLAIDIAKEYGFVLKTRQMPDMPPMKEPAKNNWLDEDGEDEYLASTHFQAIDYEFSVYVRTSATASLSAVEVLANQKRAFFEKIKSGEFSFFDDYWKYGRRKVRYVSAGEPEKKQEGDWAREIFSIKFKINDPLTKMVLDDDGIIVEA